jgi:Protein of unknown function (DUF2721)
MSIEASNYTALSAMITPAILMTSNGSFIISTSNRMARVVDRIRVLNDLADAFDRGATELDYVADRLAHIRDQQARLVWRSERIQFALAALYMSFGAFVGASLALALNAWTGHRLAVVPELLAIVGVVLMLSACIHLVLEAIEALRSNRMEIQFYRGLFEKRRREKEAIGPQAASPS